MEHEITCPHCQRKITGNPIIEDAAKGLGADNRFIICECGERISYRQITAQVRDQKTTGKKVRAFLQGIFKGQG